MILMLGDVHGNFRHVERVVDEHRPAAVIFLGDIEAKEPLHEILKGVMDKTEVYWIPGNHDTDNRGNWNNLYWSELDDRNLHGRVVEIDGVRVAGLGGIFREEIWYPDPATSPAHYDSYFEYEERSEAGRIIASRKGRNPYEPHDPDRVLISMGKLLKHRSSIFYRDWFDLYGQQADILVTHEAPSCHPNGFSVIDDLARSMHVKFAFHGHHHDRLNYEKDWDRLEFQAHGVGFCGVTDQWGGMISAGDFDDN